MARGSSMSEATGAKPFNPCATCKPEDNHCCTSFPGLMPFLKAEDMTKYMGNGNLANKKKAILDAVEAMFPANHPEGILSFTPVKKVINGVEKMCCPFLRILKNRCLCRIYEDRPLACVEYKGCGKFPGEKLRLPLKPGDSY